MEYWASISEPSISWMIRFEREVANKGATTILEILPTYWVLCPTENAHTLGQNHVLNFACTVFAEEVENNLGNSHEDTSNFQLTILCIVNSIQLTALCIVN